MVFVKLLEEYWESIIAQPLFFALTAIVFFGFGWVICKALHKIQVGTLRERIGALKEKLEHTNEKLAASESDAAKLGKVVEEFANLKEQLGQQPKIRIVEQLPPVQEKNVLYFVTEKKSA